ncbi:MAG: hypothetical protein FJX78_05930 [Armatimonadetes bacterium]|nr:hypothetical protein [Armatimonadota bacterium]
MTGELHDISAKIGELSGLIDGLQRANAMAEARADFARSSMQGSLDAINKRLECLATLRVQHETHAERIAFVEGVARDYAANKNRVLGGAALLGFVGAGVGWLFSKLWP